MDITGFLPGIGTKKSPPDKKIAAISRKFDRATKRAIKKRSIGIQGSMENLMDNMLSW